jgi:hypothetical protein
VFRAGLSSNSFGFELLDKREEIRCGMRQAVWRFHTNLVTITDVSERLLELGPVYCVFQLLKVGHVGSNGGPFRWHRWPAVGRAWLSGPCGAFKAIR